MLPFLIPFISNVVSNSVTAAVVGKHAYKRGEKDGYIRCSKEYEEKLRRQADLFLTTTDKWKKERDEYEALLDEYELVITELEAKIAATNSNEYKQRLTNVKSYRRKLFSLAN